MYLRKILTDGNKEFMKNMRIEFDYQNEHYIVRIKKLNDTYFESYDGTCFDYDEIRNCKKGYVVGEEVTVSIKTLYESPVCVEDGWINTEKDENGNIGYYDLYTTYVITAQPTANRRLYYVTNINATKYLTTITLHEIFSGKTRAVKMWTSAYNRNPFSKGDVLYIIKLDKKHQKEPTGEINPVTGKKVYRDVPDKYEFWLNRFVIKNDIEEVEEDLQ